MRKTLLFALLLAALARAGDEPLRVEISAGEVPLFKHWYGVYIQGNKSGYARHRLERRDGQYVQQMRVRLELKSMGKQVRMDVVEELRFDDSPPFALAGGRFHRSGRGVEQETTLERTEKGFVADVSGRKMELPPIELTLADIHTLQAWIRKGPKAGDSVVTRSFDLSQLKAVRETFVLKEAADVLVHGVKARQYSGALESSIFGPAGTLRFTGEGTLVSLVHGAFLEMRLEPKETAKRIEQGGDVFLGSMAKLDRPLGDPRKVKGLVLEITGEGASMFKAGPRQSVARNEAGALIVRIGAMEGKAVEATRAEIAENLKETAAYPVRDREIVALAKRAVGDAATERKKVDRLVRFVSRYVEDELRPEPVSVLQVVESRRGDCQEHSILFAALARTAGIPARTVSGLAYVGDAQGAFAGHAWNEVVLDGRWVPVDSTWNETEIDAAHIRVGSGIRGLAEIGWALGQIRIKLVAVER